MVRTVRGAQYKVVMHEVTPELVQAAKRIHSAAGKFTLADIGVLAQQVDLPVKTTCQFLEYDGFLPSGIWDRLVDRGATSRMIRQAVSAQYDESKA